MLRPRFKTKFVVVSNRLLYHKTDKRVYILFLAGYECVLVGRVICLYILCLAANQRNHLAFRVWLFHQVFKFCADKPQLRLTACICKRADSLRLILKFVICPPDIYTQNVMCKCSVHHSIQHFGWKFLKEKSHTFLFIFENFICFWFFLFVCCYLIFYLIRHLMYNCWYYVNLFLVKNTFNNI